MTSPLPYLGETQIFTASHGMFFVSMSLPTSTQFLMLLSFYLDFHFKIIPIASVTEPSHFLPGSGSRFFFRLIVKKSSRGFHPENLGSDQLQLLKTDIELKQLKNLNLNFKNPSINLDFVPKTGKP